MRCKRDPLRGFLRSRGGPQLITQKPSVTSGTLLRIWLSFCIVLNRQPLAHNSSGSTIEPPLKRLTFS